MLSALFVPISRFLFLLVFPSCVTVNGKSTLKYEEDLFPGDCFAESALDGIRNRLATIQAVTPCDIAVVEYHDFAAATIKNSQKESVDDRVQFLIRTPIFRHWDGVDLYRIASVMTREEYPKSTVMISKGVISKKLCLLMEGRIDVVVGLNPHQMQHVVTTINQHECFNESGILTHMSMPTMPSSSGDGESFVETCFAVSGSHVMLLCLSENNYHLLDQNTIEKLSVAFREKNIWRLDRMTNLRAESRNINRWKKELRLVSDKGTTAEPTVGLLDLARASKVATHLLDNLPIIDFGLDPMIALSTCKNLKECRHVQTTLKDLCRPRTAKRTPFDDEIPLTRKTVVYSPAKLLRRSQSLPNFGVDDDESLPSLSPPKTLGPSPLSPLRIRTLLVGSSRLPRRPFEELNIPTI